VDESETPLQALGTLKKCMELFRSMSQDRLSGLATLAIEKELAENINNETVIEHFAAKKSRKINFK